MARQKDYIDGLLQGVVVTALVYTVIGIALTMMQTDTDKRDECMRWNPEAFTCVEVDGEQEPLYREDGDG